MHTLLQDLRYAIRQAAARPGLTALAIASLALGIGVNSTVFSVVNAALLRDLPAQRPEEMVEVYVGQEKQFRYATASYPDFLDLRAQSRDVLADLAAVNLEVATHEAGGTTELLFGEGVSANYFDLLGLRPAAGRSFLPAEEQTLGTHAVALLGHRFWQRRFGGDPAAVGKPLRLNGVDFTIVGVAPAAFSGSFPGLAADFLFPLAMHDRMAGSTSLTERDARSLFLKGRLREGVALERAQAALDTVARRLAAAYPESNRDVIVTLVPSRQVALNPQIDGPLYGAAGLLLAVVGMVLLIACSNIANLLLARASERRREIAVRLALGAGRGRLVRQMLTESVLLAAVGGAAGLLLALWTARLLVTFKPPLPIPLSLDIPLDARVLGFTMAVALLTGLLCGLAPALQSSRPALVPALKEGAGSLGRSRYRFLGLRNLLVVAQVTISTVLLVGAGLFLRSLGEAQAIDPGFTLRQGVAAQIALELGGAYDEAEGRAFQERVLERVRTLPGVRSAALASQLPLGLSIHISRVELEGKPIARPEEGEEVDRTEVSPGYFATLGIPLLRGRDFAPTDAPGKPRVAIVNETAARRFWPGEDPIGKRLRPTAEKGEGEWWTVVGVARDGKYRTLGEEPRPFFYANALQHYTGFITLVAATQGDERAALADVRRLLAEMDPHLPLFDLKTFTQHLAIMLFPARMGAVLLAAFGGLGLLLASLGLYGVVAASVVRRTREVGIRMAIGARKGDVLRLVVGEGMALAGVGLALGTAVALAAAGVLRGMLYGIAPSDPATFVGVALVLAGVALCANLVPAQRAAQVDPSIALRHE